MADPTHANVVGAVQRDAVPRERAIQCRNTRGRSRGPEWVDQPESYPLTSDDYLAKLA